MREDPVTPSARICLDTSHGNSLTFGEMGQFNTGSQAMSHRRLLAASEFGAREAGFWSRAAMSARAAPSDHMAKRLYTCYQMTVKMAECTNIRHLIRDVCKPRVITLALPTPE